jgi:hypothetical protein
VSRSPGGNEVYAQEGYEQSVANLSQVSLDSDGVFGDDGGANPAATAPPRAPP